MVETFNIFFSRTIIPMILKLGMQYLGLKLNKVYVNDDFGFTLTYCMARLKLDPMFLNGENCNKVNAKFHMEPPWEGGTKVTKAHKVTLLERHPSAVVRPSPTIFKDPQNRLTS